MNDTDDIKTPDLIHENYELKLDCSLSQIIIGLMNYLFCETFILILMRNVFYMSQVHHWFKQIESDWISFKNEVRFQFITKILGVSIH